ncbi:hypothetical protein EWM64_g604 [Hericium alpestre]|uniref:Ubiquinone biosynthesis protein COQ4, mitochondrial n=1 Tax=Hericium alpestre TaxID=135208 RepID=A0A4Z0ACJ1_9AGAM|nr:hypothetical protein EWM64_g604 [Hericium alpestre]
MVAAVGDTTSGPVLPILRDRMLRKRRGRRILKERPRVNSSTVDMQKLAQLPEGTFGRTYVSWLERCGVTPDTREPVHYVNDPELAYVLQRYRECHDFYHAICFLPVYVEYEVALKFFEFAKLGPAGRGAVDGCRDPADPRQTRASVRGDTNMNRFSLPSEELVHLSSGLASSAVVALQTATAETKRFARFILSTYETSDSPAERQRTPSEAESLVAEVYASPTTTAGTQGVHFGNVVPTVAAGEGYYASGFRQ